MRLCVAVALCAARAAARSQPHAAAKPAKPRSTRPLCAAATVAPFHPARPLSNATELYPNPACSARYAELRAINARPTEVVTITYLYYADSEFLAKHVEYWNAYPTTLLEKIHFLVVDDGSPAGRRAAPIVEKNRGPASVSVVEIDQDLVWNVAGARNLAAVVAPTDVLMLNDMDYRVPPGVAEWAIAHSARVAQTCHLWNGFPRDEVVPHVSRTGAAVTCSGRAAPASKGAFGGHGGGCTHPGVSFFSKKTYWHLGGNEEDLVGFYGHTDPIFRWKALATYPICDLKQHPRDVPELQRVSAGDTGPRASRWQGRNKALFHNRTTGVEPFSTTVLRFSWRIAATPY